MNQTRLIIISYLIFSFSGCNGVSETPDNPLAKKSHLVSKDISIFFPLQKPNKLGIIMASVTHGQLVLNGECLQLKIGNPINKQLFNFKTPIWPYGYSYSIDEKRVLRIRDENDEVIAKLGDIITMGGGEIKLESNMKGHFEVQNADEIRKHCSPPYFYGEPKSE